MNNKSKPNGSRPASRPQRKAAKPKGRGPQKGPVDRNTRAFIAMAKQASTSVARVNSTAKGSHVNHRELLGTVNGSVAFTAVKYACNPGLAATFPWLSTQAANWEQYRFNRLRFRYLTRTATTTVGSVILAPDYDPSDAAPASEQAVSTYQDAVEDAVWVEQLVCDLNVQAMFPNGMRKFVRSAAVGSEDLKLYDAANFFVCTLEEIGTSAIGKLWVEYDVDFFTPQTASASAPSSRYTSRYADDASMALTTATITPILFRDLVFDPLGIGAAVAGVFTPPRGAYLVQAMASPSDASAEAFAASIEIYKNGAALTNRSVGASEATVPAGGDLCVSTNAILECSGSDTFQVQITCVGAAGVLTLPANRCSLVVSPA